MVKWNFSQLYFEDLNNFSVSMSESVKHVRQVVRYYNGFYLTVELRQNLKSFLSLPLHSIVQSTYSTLKFWYCKEHIWGSTRHEGPTQRDETSIFSRALQRFSPVHSEFRFYWWPFQQNIPYEPLTDIWQASGLRKERTDDSTKTPYIKSRFLPLSIQKGDTLSIQMLVADKPVPPSF